MTSFRHVTRINVSLWGHRVGTIIENTSRPNKCTTDHCGGRIRCRQ